MIIDQLFTHKPLQEGGPYDLPGKDYARPGDTPRKRPSGEHNPYPYSPEEDDDHFREIFRKKREAAAKDQGMAEATAAPTAGVPAPGVAKPAVATQPATAPAQDPSQPYLDKLGARAGAAPGSNITQVTDAYQQKLLDRMGKRFGLPPGSTADQVQAAQQAYLDKNDPTAAAQYKQNMANIDAGNTAANKPLQLAPKAPGADFTAGLAAQKAGASPTEIMLAQPGIAGNQSLLDAIAPSLGLPAGSTVEQLKAAAKQRAIGKGPAEQQAIDDIAKGQGLPAGMTRDELMAAWKKKVTGQFAASAATPAQPVAENAGRAVNDKGLTQQRWLQLVQTKFPTAKIVQAKMIDGPCRATLPDGRTLSWTKVEQGVAEKVGDLRPKLGSARDKGKSVRKWRNERGLDESKPLQNSQVYNLGHKSLSEALELYFGKNSKPISEGNRNNQLRLMEETTFRNGYAFARLLVEKNLTKDQVLQLFKDVEQGATAAGGNRTGLGKAKDATTQAIGSVQKMLAGARQWVKERPTYQAVDAEYNRAMTALGKVGGESGEANAVAKAIYKYRDMAKKYPRATGLAKWAIISAAGFLTGGLGGVGVSAGLAAIDSALKDNEIIDIVKDAGYAAAVGGAIQGAGDLASAASDAYYGMPSASEIAANNAALGDWNDTDIPGGPASNINGLDLPPDQVSGLTADGDPNIVGPGVEALSPEEAAKAAAQAKAYGFDGDVTLDQLNQAIMQTAEPGTVPADYSQLGAGADTGGSTYTVTADDAKGLGKIAQDNGLTAKQLWDANPQITDPDKIFVGQEINIPVASGEPVKNVWQDWDGPTKPTAPAVEPGPGDTVPTLSNPSAASDYGMGGNAPIDYRQPGPESIDSLGQKLEYGMPVNDRGSFIPPNPALPPEELAKQTAAYNSWKSDFMKRFPNATLLPNGEMQAIKPGLTPMYPGMTPKTFESVKFKIIPAEQLIDQKLTVLSWALNESVNRKGHQSVHLTTKGVRTVFENIGRCRRAYLKEYIGAPTADYGHPTAAGAPASATAGQGKPQGWFGKTLDTIGRGVDKVGSYVSNVGHNVITKVTADKLNNMWNRAGEPYDSNRLYQLLTTEWGVPKQVVDSVFSKMGIPYTAPATAQSVSQADAQTATPTKTGGAQRQAYAGTNPATGKPWTVDELQARMNPGTAPAPESPSASTTPTSTGTFPGEDPKGPGYVGRREVARRQAARDAEAAKKPAAPNFAQQGGGYKSVNYAPNIKTGVNLPKPTAPATTTTQQQLSPADTVGTYNKKTGAATLGGKPMIAAKDLPPNIQKQLSGIKEALTQPVTELLQMVETKEDVQRIKQFVNETFVRYGAVNESAFALRNQILEHVTQVGAQRRREHSQRVAH